MKNDEYIFWRKRNEELETSIFYKVSYITRNGISKISKWAPSFQFLFTKKWRWGVEMDFKFPIHRQIIYPTRLSKQRLSGTDKQVNEEAVSFILRNP